MHTHCLVIDLWPSTAQFAREMGENANTALAWRRRGIPPRAWSKVSELSLEKGFPSVNVELLHKTYVAESNARIHTQCNDVSQSNKPKAGECEARL